MKKKKETKRVSHSVARFWAYYFMLSVVEVLFLPLIAYRTIKEIRLYRKCSARVYKAVNDDKEFFNFLDKHGFTVARFTRLYTVQEIPKELKKLEEHELSERIIQNMLPLQPIFERNQLLDILVTDFMMIDEESFVFAMEIFNFKPMIRFVIKLAISILLYITAAILLIVLL